MSSSKNIERLQSAATAAASVSSSSSSYRVEQLTDIEVHLLEAVAATDHHQRNSQEAKSHSSSSGGDPRVGESSSSPGSIHAEMSDIYGTRSERHRHDSVATATTAHVHNNINPMKVSE
jgi:hypothetical protein